MLLKYKVYSPTMNQFITEINNVKSIKYDISIRAYNIEFNDDTHVLVPKEHNLNDDITMRSFDTIISGVHDRKIMSMTADIRDRAIPTSIEEKHVPDDFYTLADNLVAVHRIDDIREAQLRLNYDYSIEFSNIVNSPGKIIAITDKVFRETLLDDVDNGKDNTLHVRAFDGNNIIEVTTFKPNDIKL